MKKINLNYFMYLGIFILGLASMYGIVYFYPNLVTKEVTKVVKDVTITDTGISDAVDKEYDSVVVVLNYKNDTLYATGSGFAYKIDGNDTYIITNNHVISDGTSFKVTISDDETIDATLVGSDEYSDIAVLKVKTNENLPVSNIGSSESLSLGDTVFAIGAPVSSSTYAWTVTRGIISGKDRLVELSEGYVTNVLQTDTAVNSGNSGGPLCNSNGEVIGVVNAKITMTNVEGMGFAIPVERATAIADKIISGEKVTYPYLGISMLDVSTALNYTKYNSYLNDKTLTYGVIITSVEKGSSAEKAGLKAGDVILKIDDTVTKTGSILRYALYNHEVGDSITITYNRDGKEMTASVTLKSNSSL